MELRDGYKQTEIGVIPEEWDAVRVGDLFTFKNGLNKAKRFFGQGTPIINYMDVFGRSSLRMQEIYGRVEVGKAELKSYEVCRGDVFFTRTSETVDEIGVASVMLDNAQQTVFSGFVLRARPIVDALVDEFKSYCFSPRYFRQQVTTRASYTTRALINGRSLSATLLAKPPKSEQSAIATALSDVDALLAAQDALIAKKRAIKQGAMQELLTGKRRLPGFSGEWELKSLGELCSLKSGEAITAAHIDEQSPFPCYGGNGLRGFTQSYTHEGDYALIGRQGALCGNVIAVSGRFFASEHALVVTPEVSTDIRWLAYTFARANLNQYSESSAQPGLSASKLLLLEFSTPPTKAEQAAIADALSSMDEEIAVLESKRAKTAQLKRGMMQALLTGRVRLI